MKIHRAPPPRPRHTEELLVQALLVLCIVGLVVTLADLVFDAFDRHNSRARGAVPAETTP